jgi:hypothetical protein
MSLLLSGSDGLSDVDGTAATPAIRGTDANTGIFFPAADTIAFSEGGAEVARFDSSGNFGIGVSNPINRLRVSSPLTGTTVRSNTVLRVQSEDTGRDVNIQFSDNVTYAAEVGMISGNLYFTNNGTERMRIDSSGNVFVGKTSAGATGGLAINIAGRETANLLWNRTSSTITSYPLEFQNGGSIVGFVSYTNTGTTYTTSSDYRLKEDVAPMTGALATVAALKPVTYTWKSTGEAGQGFIAHELQAVIPDCVTGEKDAVETVDDLDAEGRKIGTKEVPRYQGVDTSFLVATLVAAIQEQQAIISAMETRLAALEA